jgi:tryptophanyl-tRNA synthetase
VKVDLAELIISSLKPVQDKYHELMKNRDYLDQLLMKGRDRARARAAVTLKNVYQAVGLVR